MKSNLIKSCIIVIFLLYLSSCSSYRNYDLNGYMKVEKVLTVTSSGDTLAVPLKQFQKHYYDNSYFNFDRFNWNFGLYGLYSPYNYGWNNPYWGWNYRPWRNNNFFFNDLYYRPSVSYSVPTRPQVQPSSSETVRVNVRGRRGERNFQDGIYEDGGRYEKLDQTIQDLRRRGIRVNTNNNDKDIRFNTRTPVTPQSGYYGWGSWSRQIVPTQSTRPSFSAPSQPGQVRGGSQQPSIQQSGGRNSSSGQRGGKPIE